MTALASLPVLADSGMAYDDPSDWALWETYRGDVQHPCTLIKPEDLVRAKANMAAHEWARAYADRIRKNADAFVTMVTPDYLADMAEVTTPGCTGPCPECRDQGKRWHPNGQWTWSFHRPKEIKCRVCRAVYPNDKHPESVALPCTWDPRQVFTFYGGDTFKCFSYRYARPTFTGIIRAKKFGFLSSQLETLAVAYALHDDPAYARAARDILLRIAEVFPKYVVRAGYGYGEFSNCDPHTACERINNLPNDELVYPPNKPDRRIHTGYWSASRVGSSGMDGGWLTRVTLGYDLTCEARDGDTPVYSEEQRLRIERDVLLEGSYLAACDKSINNKSVGNRAGAAMVGLCVGHPGLVRFGLDGFVRTVDDWFLPDGGTSESAAYAMMTMGGIRPFGLAFRDYSEPDGYKGPDGKRLQHFNSCRDTRYGTCWQGLLWTLQGNLRHPAIADSYRTTTVSAAYAELIALAFPTDEHVAYLGEVAGRPAGRAAREAIFYRKVDSAQLGGGTPFELPDVVFPYLSQGYLRLGEDGRSGAVVLNASDWGGHHHYDSLDLYMWKDGHELLSDLGYLWDHPDKKKTYRTGAHNLVTMDGKEQERKGRGGSFHLYAVMPRVKVMEASSTAYSQATEYRRTCIQVDHAEHGAYLVDIFRVAGGRKREYVFHGPGNDYEVQGLELAPASGQASGREKPVNFGIRFHLNHLAEICLKEIVLQEVDAAGKLGANLALPPLGATLGREKRVAGGWGCYIGNGAAVAAPAPGEPDVTRFVATKAQNDGVVNVAFIVGETDGYQGTAAFTGRPGQRYRLCFSIKGTARKVGVQAVYWHGAASSPRARRYEHLDIKNTPVLATGEQWVSHEAVFSLPSIATDVENELQAVPSGPWSIRWALNDGYTFASHFAGGGGDDRVRIGADWGQRDHRNSDRGAVLPYIFRERSGEAVSDAFVTVFEGAQGGKELVTGVRLLKVASDAECGAVAVLVSTRLGSDIVISQVGSGDLRIEDDGISARTDGRAAVASWEGTQRCIGALIEGTELRVPLLSLSAEPAAFSGNVLGVGGEDGASWFDVSPALPENSRAAGSALLVTGDDGIERAYPIRRQGAIPEGTRLFTEYANRGFPAFPANTWRISNAVFIGAR